MSAEHDPQECERLVWRLGEQMRDAQAERDRYVHERDEARQERDLMQARLLAVRQTLLNVGAPTHDENGYGLNANGMLVDWLAGRRDPKWIGPDPMRELQTEVERLREALRDAVDAVSSGQRDIIGRHEIYTAQIDVSAVERWRAALA